MIDKRNSPTPKVCDHCGETFDSANKQRKYCSDRCRRLRWTTDNDAGCIDCGKVGNAYGERCIECRRQHCAQQRREKREQLVALWGEGHPVKEIARIVGRTVGSTNVEIAKAKRDGYEFPPRRKGWKGHSRPTGPAPTEPTTRLQARHRTIHAIRYGRLVRPDACERCGRTGHVDAHHHDYSKPLDVEWLCPACHRAHHAAEKVATHG